MAATVSVVLSAVAVVQVSSVALHQVVAATVFASSPGLALS